MPIHTLCSVDFTSRRDRASMNGQQNVLNTIRPLLRVAAVRENNFNQREAT
jgi:hypothetical protein